ncbi:MAG: M36 family metallopeptidase [Bacteroidota bacterium]
MILSSNVLLAQKQSPLDVALRHFDQHRVDYDLTEADVSNFALSDLYTSRHNGVTHVYLRQQHAGISLGGAITNFNILPDGRVLSMGNRFVADLAGKVNGTEPGLSPEAAVAVALQRFQNRSNPKLVLQEQVSAVDYVYAPGDFTLEPITAGLRYHLQTPEEVRLVWQVRLHMRNGQNVWKIMVDAASGEILHYRDQVLHCSFDKAEDCEAVGHNHQHHDHYGAAKFAPSVSAADYQMASGGTYNVFALPLESPSHGGRTIEVDPADELASPFGWHDVTGDDTLDYTITRGNNVHAYHDIFDLNEPIGGEPDGGPELNFDFPLDLDVRRPFTQLDPTITNLFYWNNIIHDICYHYGFTEESGNFQVNNYGRGGIGEDDVRAEAMDGSGTNNANFFTPVDGERPRMQMYIWEVEEAVNLPFDTLIINAPDSVAGKYRMRGADFGAPITDGFGGEVVLAVDSVDTPEDVCEPVANADEVVGKITLLDRGECNMGLKALNAQNAGAIGVLICNNNAGEPFPAGGGEFGDSITIPVAMLDRSLCDTLKLALPLDVNFQAIEFIIPNPGPRALDSDLDNGVIVHEYGHGISNRLTGGPAASDCLNNFEQAGEGWSDWFALAMQTLPGAAANDNRGIGTYVLDEPTDGVGIRNFPYNRDMGVNPHTYAALDSVSRPHGIGSVFAATLWDLYWNLVDEYGFSEDIYQGTAGNNIAMQLVMDGLKLQPCDPSLIESRDAIIAADVANNDGANVCMIWQTFARRGFGFLARPGLIGDERNPFEDFVIPPSCFTFVKVDKMATEEIEDGDIISYNLNIVNATNKPQTNVIITDVFPEGTSLVDGSLDCAGATVEDNTLTLSIDDLAIGDTVRCSYQLQTTPQGRSLPEISETGDSINNDIWRSSASLGITRWTPVPGAGRDGSSALFAENVPSQSDQRLSTRDPILLEGPQPILSFWHSYNTELSKDGGIVEMELESGGDWFDLGAYIVTNPYPARHDESQTSILTQRASFTGNSNGYIHTIIDLSDFVGEEVKIRFRFICDNMGSEEGWYIDDIKLFSDATFYVNKACATSDLQTEFCSSGYTIAERDGSTATIDPVEQLGVYLFPNPTSGQLQLQLSSDKSEEAELRISALDGRTLERRVLGSTNAFYDLDMSSYNPGIYLLHIQTEGTRVVRKVVLQ